MSVREVTSNTKMILINNRLIDYLEFKKTF